PRLGRGGGLLGLIAPPRLQSKEGPLDEVVRGGGRDECKRDRGDTEQWALVPERLVGRSETTTEPHEGRNMPEVERLREAPDEDRAPGGEEPRGDAAARCNAENEQRTPAGEQREARQDIEQKLEPSAEDRG